MPAGEGAAEVAEWLLALGCPVPPDEVRAASARLLAPPPPGGAPLGPPLRFLASRVAGEAELQRVRRNLALAAARRGGKQTSAGADEQGAAGEGVTALRAEVERARAEVQDLRAAVEMEAVGLAAAEAGLRRSAAEAEDGETRAALLSAWAGRLDRAGAALRARREGIAGEVASARAAVALASDRDGADGELVASQAATAAVAAACDVVEAELRQAVAARCPAFAASGEAAFVSQPGCACSLEDVALPRAAAETAASALSGSGAMGVLSGAAAVAAAASARLATATSELDLGRDALALLASHGRDGHQADEDADKENRPGGQSGGSLAAPRALLRRQQQQHVAAFLSTQAARNASAAARRRLKELAASAAGDEVLACGLAAARVAGQRAAVEALQREAAALHEAAANADHQAAELRQKKERIGAFRARDECLDQAIAATRRYCLTSGKRLVLDCSALNTRVGEDVVRNTACMQQSAKRMQGVVAKELSEFQGVELRSIPSLSAAAEPAEWPQGRNAAECSPQLLLQRAEAAFLAAGQPGASDPLAEVFAAAMNNGQPAMTVRAPDELLPSAAQRLQTVEGTLWAVAQDRVALAKKEAAEHAEAAADLAARGESHRAALAALEASVNEAADAGRSGIEQAEQGQSAVADWWELPALDSTPWVTVDRADGVVRIRPVREHGQPEEEPTELDWTARQWQSHMNSLVSQLTSL